MGDMNTTEREQAYADFTAGLRDAHLDAGIGPGLTWRPDELKSLPFGLIRIDYVLTSPDLVALSSTVKCTDLSDHCQVAERRCATVARLLRPGEHDRRVPAEIVFLQPRQPRADVALQLRALLLGQRLEQRPLVVVELVFEV